MLPSPSLPPTGLPQSLLAEYDTDLPLGRRSVLVRKVEVLDRFDLAGRVEEPRGDDLVVDGPAPTLGLPDRSAGTVVALALATNSALDDDIARSLPSTFVGRSRLVVLITSRDDPVGVKCECRRANVRLAFCARFGKTGSSQNLLAVRGRGSMSGSVRSCQMYCG